MKKSTVFVLALCVTIISSCSKKSDESHVDSAALAAPASATSQSTQKMVIGQQDSVSKLKKELNEKATKPSKPGLSPASDSVVIQAGAPTTVVIPPANRNTPSFTVTVKKGGDAALFYVYFEGYDVEQSVTINFTGGNQLAFSNVRNETSIFVENGLYQPLTQMPSAAVDLIGTVSGVIGGGRAYNNVTSTPVLLGATARTPGPLGVEHVVFDDGQGRRAIIIVRSKA